MTRATDLEELYTVIGAVILSSTGRQFKQERAMQGRPSTPYAAVFISQISQEEYMVVEEADLPAPDADGNEIIQIPWGTGLMECKITFYRNGDNDLVMDAGNRFLNSLRLESRFLDMWQIMGMVGVPSLKDLTAIFRADNDPRSEVRFTFNANLAGPLPLAGNTVSEIEHQPITITHKGLDGVATDIEKQIDKPV